MPQGDWAFSALRTITDGFETETEAIEAVADLLETHALELLDRAEKAEQDLKDLQGAFYEALKSGKKAEKELATAQAQAKVAGEEAERYRTALIKEAYDPGWKSMDSPGGGKEIEGLYEEGPCLIRWALERRCAGTVAGTPAVGRFGEGWECVNSGLMMDEPLAWREPRKETDALLSQPPSELAEKGKAYQEAAVRLAELNATGNHPTTCAVWQADFINAHECDCGLEKKLASALADFRTAKSALTASRQGEG
jgi:hypothetical protein